MNNYKTLISINTTRRLKKKSTYVFLTIILGLLMLLKLQGHDTYVHNYLSVVISIISIFTLFVIALKGLSEDLILGTIQHTVAHGYKTKEIIISLVLSNILVTLIFSIFSHILCMIIDFDSAINISTIKILYFGVAMSTTLITSFAVFFNSLIKDPHLGQWSLIYFFIFNIIFSQLVTVALIYLHVSKHVLDIKSKMYFFETFAQFKLPNNILDNLLLAFVYIGLLLFASIKLFNKKEF